MDNFCGTFSRNTAQVSENSVEMNFVTSLTRLVLPAFCMKFVAGVRVT